MVHPGHPSPYWRVWRTLTDGGVVNSGQDEDPVVGHVARGVDQAVGRERVGVAGQRRRVDVLIRVHAVRRRHDLVVASAVVRACSSRYTCA